MQEIWKQIPGYEGLYEVSNKGRVRSYISRTQAIPHVMSAYSLRGYLQTVLCKNRKHKTLLIHRLVALAFLGAPDNPKHEVNHKNFVKHDNRPENLEWLSSGDNNRYSKDVIPRNKGEANHSKLTEKQVREIRSRYAQGGITQKLLAQEYGVSLPTCNYIIRKIKWKHID